MIRNLKNKTITFLLIVISFFFFTIQSQTIDLYVTGNINGAVADCQCGETKNGSLARLTTFYQRTHQPEQVWVDAGNFLTSYRFPEHNTFFINHFSQLNYDVIALGEQEFIHGDKFFNNHLLKKIPEHLLFTNSRNSKKPVQPMVTIRRSGVVIYFLNIWAENYLRLTNSTDIEALLGSHTNNTPRENGSWIVFLQGDIKLAQHILQKFPFITGIIMGNNQEESLQLNSIDKSFILSPGIEAEKIGRVKLHFTAGKVDGIAAELIDLREIAEEDSLLLKEFKTLTESLN